MGGPVLLWGALGSSSEKVAATSSSSSSKVKLPNKGKEDSAVDDDDNNDNNTSSSSSRKSLGPDKDNSSSTTVIAEDSTSEIPPSLVNKSSEEEGVTAIIHGGSAVEDTSTTEVASEQHEYRVTLIPQIGPVPLKVTLSADTPQELEDLKAQFGEQAAAVTNRNSTLTCESLETFLHYVYHDIRVGIKEILALSRLVEAATEESCSEDEEKKLLPLFGSGTP